MTRAIIFPKEHANLESTPIMPVQETECCRQSNAEPELSEAQLYAELERIIEEYAGQPGCLIPVLQLTQSLFGFLPDKAVERIAIGLKKPLSEVAGVIGFYSFFSRTPQGRHQLRVCLGTACYVRGGKEVLAAIKKELGIDIGESTPDRCFSLEVGRCFGACGLAPVMMAGVDVHQRVKPSKIREILKPYEDAPIDNQNGVTS
jgi:NADH:ubiquinone oxidoreductase subunit E